MLDAEGLMRIAVEKAREGIARGQSPFGCAIAREGELLAACHNRVRSSVDVTAHAEVAALREACRRVGDIQLAGAVVATTCEPCPMCAAALHWARVETVYCGARIEDARAVGFNELAVPAARLLAEGGSRVALVPGILEAECRALFAEWASSGESRPC